MFACQLPSLVLVCTTWTSLVVLPPALSPRHLSTIGHVSLKLACRNTPASREYPWARRGIGPGDGTLHSVRDLSLKESLKCFADGQSVMASLDWFRSSGWRSSLEDKGGDVISTYLYRVVALNLDGFSPASRDSSALTQHVDYPTHHGSYCYF